MVTVRWTPVIVLQKNYRTFVTDTKDEDLYKQLPEFWEDIKWININL